MRLSFIYIPLYYTFKNQKKDLKVIIGQTLK